MLNKLSCAVLAVFAAASVAQADDSVWTGTLTSECSFTNVSPGTLAFTTSNVSSATDATFDVFNNNPGIYQLQFAATNDPSTKPAGFSASTFASQSIATSGVNSSEVVGGSASAGYTVDLTAMGTDSFTHGISHNADAVPAGSYEYTVPVTCIEV